MDTDPTSQSTQAIDFGAPATSPSLNGYGSSHDEPDVLVLIGAAFVGGLLLAAIVGRLAS